MPTQPPESKVARKEGVHGLVTQPGKAAAKQKVFIILSINYCFYLFYCI